MEECVVLLDKCADYRFTTRDSVYRHGREIGHRGSRNDQCERKDGKHIKTDLAAVNAKIFTASLARGWTDGLAVQRNRFVAAGERTETEQPIGSEA